MVIHTDADLSRITPYEKGLALKVRRNQPEIESLLGVAGIEKIADQLAVHEPLLEADPHVFQIVLVAAALDEHLVAGVGLASVVVEAARGGGVEPGEPARRVVVFHGRGELVAGCERLRPPLETKAGE